MSNTFLEQLKYDVAYRTIRSYQWILRCIGDITEIATNITWRNGDK